MVVHPLKYHSIRKYLVSIKAEEIFPSYSQDKHEKPSFSFPPKKRYPVSLGDILVFCGLFWFCWNFFFCSWLCQWLIVRKQVTLLVLDHFPYSFREAANYDTGVTVNHHRSWFLCGILGRLMFNIENFEKNI